MKPVIGVTPDFNAGDRPDMGGREPTYFLRARYSFELEMARLAVDEGLPLFGICGGLQAINVALGGSLIQDISSQVSSSLLHKQAAPATRLSHTVNVAPG